MRKRLFACLLLAFMVITLVSCAISKGEFDNTDSDKSHLTSNKPNTGLIDKSTDEADSNTDTSITDAVITEDLVPDVNSTDTGGALVPDISDTSSDSQLPDDIPQAPNENVNAPKDLILNREIIEEIASNEAVYYKWIANKNGILMVMSTYEGNNIRFSSQGVCSQGTQGTICDYFYIEKDQEVLVEVASLNEGDTQVAFTVFCFTGEEETPIPVLKNEIEIVVPKGLTYHFICDVSNMLLNVQGKEGILTYNQLDYLTDGEQSVALIKDANGTPIFFEITNNDLQNDNTYIISLTQGE